MNDRDRFEAAYGCLHASEDTYKEVMVRAQNEKDTRQRGRMTLGLSLAVTLAFGGVAYAAANSDFFATAFGRKGQQDVVAAQVADEDTGSEWTMPSMQWEDVDSIVAERLLGDAVGHANLVVESHGFTLNVQDVVVDDQGMGLASFTLSNPNGVLDKVLDSGYGIFSFDPAASDLRNITLWGGDGQMYDHYEIIDRDLSSANELHGVMYFGPFETNASGELVFSLYGWDQDGEEWEESSRYVAAVPVASREFVDGQGHVLHLSPLGGMVEAPFGESVQDGWVPDHQVIAYVDGSIYEVEGDETLNWITGFNTDSGALGHVFNRLVDPAEVASVTFNGPSGQDLAFIPVE